MDRCRECGAAVGAEDRWCGSCGAADPRSVAPPPPRRAVDAAAAVPTDPGEAAPGPVGGVAVAVQEAPTPPDDGAQGPRRGPRTRAALVVAACLVAVVAVLAPDRPAVDPDLGTLADARGASATRPPPTDLVERWRLEDLVRTAPPVDARIAPAGRDHVLVGVDVVATAGGDRGVRRVPEGLRDVAVSPDGRWAVVEGGLLVVGDLSSARTTAVEVAPDDRGWRPTGAAVAWHDGAPVFRGTGGRVGAVGPDGRVRWASTAPLRLAGAVDAGRVAVEAGGRHGVLDLADGAVRLVRDEEEVLVVAGDLVVATDATTWSAYRGPGLDPAWRRPALGGTPVATSSGVAVVGRDGALLLGPDGTAAGAAGPGRVLAAVGDGYLAGEDDRLVARTWDGDVRWVRPLPPRANVVRVDDDRIAVVAPVGTTAVRRALAVVVVATDDGTVLATTGGSERVPRRVPPVVTVVDGAVGLLGRGVAELGGLGWFDAGTGGDARGRVEAALADDRADSRVVGTVEADGRRELVRVRRIGDELVVRVGARGPWRRGVDLAGLAVGRPTGTRASLAFAAPAGGTRLVDVLTGEATDVPRLVASRGVGPLQLGRATDAAGVLLAVDGATGEVVWEGDELSATGVLGPDPTYVGPLGTAGGDRVVEVGATVVRARDLATGRVAWTVPVPAPVTAAPVVADGRVVVPLGDGSLVALDGADGAVAWRADLGDVAVALTAAGADVVVGTLAGSVVHVTGRGRLVGTTPVGERPVLDVVVVGDAVVAAVGEAVVGLGADDGTVARRDRVDVTAG